MIDFAAPSTSDLELLLLGRGAKLMTTTIDATIPWLASGTVVIFLIVCVWHNRRVGYRRVRAEKITLGEAMVQIKRSLSYRHEELSVAGTLSAASAANSTAGQLVCLNSALEQDGLQVRADAPVEQPVVKLQNAKLVVKL